MALYAMSVKIVFNRTQRDKTLKRLEKTDDVDEKR